MERGGGWLCVRDGLQGLFAFWGSGITCHDIPIHSHCVCVSTLSMPVFLTMKIRDSNERLKCINE